MKRILALILSLILCFGFIVSCSKEEEPTNVPTSEPMQTNADENSLVVDGGDVRYYYMESYETRALDPNPITLVSSLEGLNARLSELGISSTQSADTFTQGIFENCYVFVILEKVTSSREALMGYRGLSSNAEGCTIIVDYSFSYDSFYLNPDGTATYSYAVPTVTEGSAQKRCDIVVIPKTESDMVINESTTIELKKISYPIR